MLNFFHNPRHLGSFRLRPRFPLPYSEIIEFRHPSGLNNNNINRPPGSDRGDYEPLFASPTGPAQPISSDTLKLAPGSLFFESSFYELLASPAASDSIYWRGRFATGPGYGDFGVGNDCPGGVSHRARKAVVR